MASTFIPPKRVGFDSKMGAVYNPGLAKDFLKKSKFDPKTQIDIIARNSERPRIVTQYLQSELKKNLGLNVQIQLYDHKIFRDQLVTQNIPMMLMTWSADYPDGDSFLSLFETGGGNNMTRYGQAAYDEKIQKARMEWNTLKREMLYREAASMIQVKDAIVLPLFL